MNLEDELARLLIHRTDVKAIQRGSAYMPVENKDGERIPWTRKNIRDHIAGTRSFGHYIVGTDDKAKFFAFDIDLEKPKPEVGETYQWVGIEPNGDWTDMEPRECNPREAFLHPKCPDNLKRFLVSEIRTAADTLATTIRELIPEIPILVSFSGNKGLHVYGLTGPVDAGELREVAREIIAATGMWSPSRGDNFFKSAIESNDPRKSLHTVSIEIFPKQDGLSGKDLGNLMRLPLGIHAKSKQRSYFLGLSSPIDELHELPADVAIGGNPWEM